MARLSRRNIAELFLLPMLEKHLFGDFLRRRLSKFTEYVTKPGKKVRIQWADFPSFPYCFEPMGSALALALRDHSGYCWIGMDTLPGNKCLSLQTKGLRSKVTVLVLAGIKNAWRWVKNASPAKDEVSGASCTEVCCALPAPPHCPSTWTLVWTPGWFTQILPCSLPWESTGAVVVTNSFYAGSMVISCGHRWETPSLHTTL